MGVSTWVYVGNAWEASRFGVGELCAWVDEVASPWANHVRHEFMWISNKQVKHAGMMLFLSYDGYLRPRRGWRTDR